MTAVWFAARRVKLRPPHVASVEGGGSTVQQKRENYKNWQHAVKITKRLELVDTPAKLKKKLQIKYLKKKSSPTTRETNAGLTKTSDKLS